MPDPIFADPRLAALYDVLDADRSDLDVYAALVDELGATSVVDVGCGTSLDVARTKPGSERVRWIHGDVVDLPAVGSDLVVMTGNVAQMFLTDSQWRAALDAAAGAVRNAGWVVFETRDPADRAWERWSRMDTHRAVEVRGAGLVETWIELTEVALPLASFRHTFRFHADDTELVSDSTLRFREPAEIPGATLEAIGAEFRRLLPRE